MNYNNQNSKTVLLPHKRTQTVLNTLSKRYLTKWPFFLIAIIVGAAFAYTYIKYARNVYEVKATLVIKDKDKIDNDKTDLQELDLANPAKKVEIEVEVLKSRKLVSKVINDLNLGATYQIVGNEKGRSLYKNTPILYKSIGKATPGGYQFNVNIIDTGTFQIIQKDGEKSRESFNKIFKSENGLAVILSTANIKQFIRSTINVSVQDTDDIINHFEDVYETRLLDKQQPIIELSIHDENADLGKDFLNDIIAEYDRSNIDEKNKLTENTLAFIDKRLDSLSGQLTNVEKNIEGYKSSRGITDISSESNVDLQSMQSNDTKLNDVNVQLRIIDGIEKYINSPGNNNVPATIGIEDKGLADLVDELTKLHLERTRLLATTPETNYLFEPIKAQIQLTIAAIKEKVKNIKVSLSNVKSGLQSVNSNVESSIKGLPGEERGYISIKRQQGIKEGLYTYLLQKREQVALSYASTLTDVSLIDNAYLNAIIWPKKPLIFFLSIMIAIIITAVIIFINEMITNITDNADEIEAIINRPILSELVDSKTTTPIVVLDPLQKIIAQQFRALRTNLLYLQDNKNLARTILISSGKSGEGKSFVASNLGISIATSGRKTVIIDFDLHKPNIGNTFNIEEEQPGITDFINGKVAVEKIISTSKIIDNLFIITSGQSVSNPSELIENPQLDVLMGLLKDKFDDIILDTPPLRLVTDSYILSKYADISLYIVRRGITKKSELSFVNKLYSEERLPKLNVIFNGTTKALDNVGY